MTLEPALGAAGMKFFVTPLRAPDGSTVRVTADHINDHGQVVGWTQAFGQPTRVPVLWSPSTPNGLAVTAHTLPTGSTTVLVSTLRINHVGQVAIPQSNTTGASIWTPNVSNGTIGTAAPAGTGPEFASMWPNTPGPLQDVNGQPIGGTILARNVVGQTLLRFDNNFDGFWDPIGNPDAQRGTLVRLAQQPMAEGGNVFAPAINASGAVAGSHWQTGSNQQAALFERVDGVWTRRSIGPTVVGDQMSWAAGITNSGIAVGSVALASQQSMLNPPRDSFVWDPDDDSTTMVKDALEATSGQGWQLTAVYGMNERGQLIVNGRFDHDNNPATTGIPAAALLTPGEAGDTNFDFAVNFEDLVTLAQNYGTPSGANWLTADFTQDGAVNFDDLVLLAQNYGTSPAAFAADWAFARSLVPEPAVIALAATGFTFTGRRRR